jgi:hypothetical protein
MKSLQQLALEALDEATVNNFIASSAENEYRLLVAIRSACTHVEHFPPLPDYVEAKQCWQAFKDFTIPEINETFCSSEVSSTLTGLKTSMRDFVVPSIIQITAFRSMAGRKHIIKMAEEATRVKVPVAHRGTTEHWGWSKFSLYVLDLLALAELAKTSFAFRHYFVTVAEEDVECILPTLLNGNKLSKRKRVR